MSLIVDAQTRPLVVARALLIGLWIIAVAAAPGWPHPPLPPLRLTGSSTRSPER